MGATEYTNENKNRHLYIANQYPAYPQILGISSVAVAKSGDLLNAELLANNAINMEPMTKPFAKPWYTKGFVMYKLGYTAEAVDALNKAIESEPFTETAAKAHSTLSVIYSEKFKATEKAAFHAERSNQIIDASKWYKAANETGSKDAQFQIGILYHIGEGVDINLEKAKGWYKLAAEQGHIKSKSNLGAIYQIEKNFNEAIKWYTFAAEEGEPGAQHNLALIYDLGIGVEPNKAEAIKWYKLSAELGFSNSQYKLGLAYRNGDGVLKDYETSRTWFLLAADQGHIKAYFQLGEMYGNGEGVAVDIETSEKYFTQWQNAKFPVKKRFLDTPQSKQVECPSNAKIILIAGQSNAGNHLEKTNITVPSNFVNGYNGNCFKISGPALGSTGRNGSITSYVASKLTNLDPIVFVNTAVYNSSVSDWALSHQQSLSNFANSQLKMFDPNNNELVGIVWIQGEADAFTNIDYISHFSKVQKLLTNGINDTPVHYILTQSSKCDPNGPDANITDTQAFIANNSETIHIAINTDNLGNEYRMDGCHYNGDGANIIANSIAKKIEDILLR
jgi:tetratricopeptide (TPR) repeat protein